MKIVLTDSKTITNGDLSLAPLEQFGEVISYSLTPYEQIADRIADADIVLCNKTLLNAETLKAAKKLRYIGLFATGYNNIDLEATHARGITVCNAGEYSTDAVAQHTFALILSLCGRTPDYHTYTAGGHWKNSETFSPFVYPMLELSGKTIGLIGYGSIAKAVAKIALAFGMRVLVYTRTPKQDETIKFVSFDTLLESSDIISAHCPLNADSEKMFDAEAFRKCRKGALFINTARGGIVEEPALRDALESGRLGGAGIDVLAEEPMAQDCVLHGAPNTIITPHIAWAPLETRQRLLKIVMNNIQCYLEGKPTNVVS